MNNSKNNVIRNELTPTNLKRSDFYYDLPEELIAQTPAEKRDMSRLMCVSREDGMIEHRVFRDIVDYINEGDVLVINDTKVIPARLMGIKESTGIAMETLLLRQTELDTWECLLKPGRRAKMGTQIVYGDGLLRASVIGDSEDGCKILRFSR